MTSFNDPQAMWNTRFSRPDYLFGEEPNVFLIEQALRLSKGRALALADGEGRNSVWLAKQGLEVDAFDFSQPAIEKANKLAFKHGVKVNFQCADWKSFNWKADYYDVVVGIFFQFAGPLERNDLFNKIKQSIKPGGLLVIQGYGKNQLRYNTGGPGKIENLYDEALLRDAFNGFDIQVCTTYETIIEEGSGHSGMSALVGFVAKKP